MFSAGQYRSIEKWYEHLFARYLKNINSQIQIWRKDIFSILFRPIPRDKKCKFFIWTTKLKTKLKTLFLCVSSLKPFRMCLAMERHQKWILVRKDIVDVLNPLPSPGTGLRHPCGHIFYLVLYYVQIGRWRDRSVDISPTFNLYIVFKSKKIYILEFALLNLLPENRGNPYHIEI